MNNKIAYTAWLIFNLFAFLVLSVSLKQDDLAFFTSIFICSLYAYAVAYFWCVLRNHIKLESAVKEIELVNNSLLERIDNIASLVVSNTSNWVIAVPILYWFVSAILSLWNWLSTGMWSQLQVCDVYFSFCLFNSKALGLNQVVHWIGNSDFGVLLLIICIPFAVGTKLLSNSIEIE